MDFMKKHVSWILSATLLFATPVMADVHPDLSIDLKDQSVPVFTLTDVIALAIRNNTSLQQAKLDRINQKFDLLLAKWFFRPQYSLNSAYTYNHSADGSGNSRGFSLTPKATLNSHFGTALSVSGNNNWDYNNKTTANPLSAARYSPSLTLEIKQQLSQGVNPAVVDAALNDAEDNEYENKLKFEDDVTSAVGTVIDNYVQLINDQLNLETEEENLEALQETVKNTQLQIKAGQLAQISLVDAQSQVASAKLSIEQAKNTIFSARETLLDSIGLQPNTPFRLPNDLKGELQHDEDILTDGRAIPDLEQSESIALKNNSSYQVAATTVTGAARDLMVTKDKNRWDLSLDATRTQGSSSVGATGFANGKNVSNQLSLNLSVPIDDLQKKADLVKSQVALDNAITSLSKAKRQLFSQVRDDLNSVVSTEQQLELAKKAVVLQQQNVDMTNKLHQFGRVTTFELLQKQQELVTDKAAVITAETTYLNSLVQFDTQLNSLLDRWDIHIGY
jgi:outer membrane protein TolC